MVHDDSDIPFDDEPPIHGPWPPNEWELRDAGYDVHWAIEYDAEVRAEDLDGWRPRLPDKLTHQPGWLLAAKQWHGLDVSWNDDGGDDSFNQPVFLPAALWARRTAAPQ